MDETPEDDTQPVDPILHIQNAIAEAVDDGSLVTGFVVIAEFIEEDGEPSLSVITSPMTAWHLEGMLRYGYRYATSPELVSMPLWDDEDDDLS